MKAQSTCPDSESLVGMLDSDLPQAQQQQVTQHVGACGTCQQRVESLVTHGFPEGLDFENVGTHLRNAAQEEATLSRDAIQRLTAALLDDTVVFHGSPGQLSLDFLEPSQNADSLGRLGQYEITEVIGRGGMGIALKGRDTRLDRVVAVKVLAPELASNPTARKRFLREARAAAAVSHDHVVTTFAVEPGDLPYLAMEFIDGQSLQQKIDRNGPLELREILRIGMQTAYGLAAAHAQGLIHRDIKPSNILLQNSVERVQITDFGLARAVDDVTITRTGEVTGTPQYMSPEQARGLPVDRRADLFSLGSVLYAMCTGRSPFRAESTMAVLHRVCNDSPRPISEVNADIPKWFTAIIDRLLEKEAGDRFHAAAEVADLLSQCLAHVQQPTVVPLPEPVTLSTSRHNGKPTRRTKWYVGAILLALVFGSLGLTEATGVTQFSASVISIVRGDGTLVVEVNDPEVSVTIEGEDIVITGAGPKEVRLRPGGYRLKAQKDGKPMPLEQDLVNITRGGRQVVRVTFKQDAALPTTSITDPRVFAGGGKGLNALALSPDGKLVAGAGGLKMVNETNSTGGDFSITLWDVAGGKLIRKFTGHENVLWPNAICFSPDGKYLASASFDKTVRLWNVETGGEIRRYNHDSYVHCVAFSPDGNTILSGSVDSSLILWDVDNGTELRRFEGHQSAIFSVAYSPDGRQIVSGGGSHLEGHDSRLRLWNVETGELVRSLPNDFHSINTARFLSDGRRVVLTGLGRGEANVAEIWDVQTGHKLSNVGTGKKVADIALAAVSTDGSYLLVSTYRKEMELWDLQSNKLIAEYLHEDQIRGVTFSPDDRLAFSASFDGNVRMWQLPESVWPKLSPLEKEISEYRKIIDEKSGKPAAQRAVTDALWKMAKPLNLIGRAQEAEATLLKAIDLYQPIVKQNPTHFDSRHFELLLMRDLATARSGAFRIDTWRAALELAERLRHDFPHIPKAVEAESFMAAALATDIGEGLESTELFVRAQSLAESIDASDILFKIHVRRGQMLFRRQEFPQAEESLRSAIGLWKSLGTNPDDSQWLLHGMAYRDLGQTLAAVDRRQEAIAALEHSVEILEKLVADTPKNRIVATNLKECRDMLAELLQLEKAP